MHRGAEQLGRGWGRRRAGAGARGGLAVGRGAGGGALYDERDGGHVDAAREHVGRDEEAGGARAKVAEHLLAKMRVGLL